MHFLFDRQVELSEVGGAMPEGQLRPSTPELSELQLKCLEGFWNRRSAKQIAADLGISEAWVNKNLLNARRKLHVNSSAEAAAIVFGGKRGSIKSYYYQETDLPEFHVSPDQVIAGGGGSPVRSAASERALINTLGVGQTLGLIFAVAIGVIAGLLLMLQAAVGIHTLWKALGY
jgi:DNA-binding CsgD family transcriptional regulator